MPRPVSFVPFVEVPTAISWWVLFHTLFPRLYANLYLHSIALCVFCIKITILLTHIYLIPFQGRVVVHLMDTPHFVEQSSTDGRFGYFLFFMVTNKAYVCLFMHRYESFPSEENFPDSLEIVLPGTWVGWWSGSGRGERGWEDFTRSWACVGL